MDLKLLKLQTKYSLSWTEAGRALCCLLPMLIVSGLGKTTFVIALGQGGFLYSSLFLPDKIGGRIVMGLLILSLGLGFYLMGGTVAPNPILAVFFTFLVCLSLSFLGGWQIGGPIALTLVVFYTAGLNVGSPEKAVNNFMVFALVLTWSALVSLLSVWEPIRRPLVETGLRNSELAEEGLKIGIGAALALAISYMANFSKLGWAPSAVGNVVRYDPALSRQRAWVRLAGTISGAFLAAVALAFITNLAALVWVGTVFATLNGLFKKTNIGLIPVFYTATLLLFYSGNNLAAGPVTILERILFNLVGITIGLLVVLYPLPQIVKRLSPKLKLT